MAANQKEFGEFRAERRLSQTELDNFEDFMQDSNSDVPANTISLTDTVAEFSESLKPTDNERS